MRQCLSDLQVFATPKAEKMFEFDGIANVEFDFPKHIRTVLFVHCGAIRGRDEYEVVGRLYTSLNPQQTNENHAGKLYVYVSNSPGAAPRFATKHEVFEWHADGSFDVIGADGVRHSRTKPIY